MSPSPLLSPPLYPSCSYHTLSSFLLSRTVCTPSSLLNPFVFLSPLSLLFSSFFLPPCTVPLPLLSPSLLPLFLPSATSSSTSKLKPSTRWYIGPGQGQVPPSPGVASLQPSLSPGPRSPSSHASILGSVGEVGKPRGVCANASQIGTLVPLYCDGIASASGPKHTGLKHPDVM